jgi:membrane-bound lytic murein transglycosylase D
MGVKMRKVPVAAPVASVSAEASASSAAAANVASPLPPAEVPAQKAVAQAPTQVTKSITKSAAVTSAAKAKEVMAAVAKAEPTDTATSSAAVAATEYVVRRGDNLSKVAREQRVSVAQIVAWNNLPNEVVTPGQRLRLSPSDDAPEAVEKVVASAPPARKKATQPRVAEKPLPLMREQQRVHVVQPGDTLYNISRRYQGLTVEQLRKLNHLKSDEVKPGQKLIVAS